MAMRYLKIDLVILISSLGLFYAGKNDPFCTTVLIMER